MKQASLLLTLAIAVVLVSAAAPKANAGVVLGVRVGSPVYVRPAPLYPYVVPRPYVAYGPRVARRVYLAPAPVYSRYGYSRRYYARRDHDWRWDHGRDFYRRSR